MKCERLAIPHVLLIEPARHGDARGFFSEVWRDDVLVELGADSRFVQDNHAFSAKRGVLRGLHCQASPYAQGKLLRRTHGRILDVAVAMRVGAPSFGKHVAVELSASNWRQIWAPPGFAHGYLTLEPDCELLYKVTTYYNPAREAGIAWDDPDLAIDSGLPADEIAQSPRDRDHPRLANVAGPFESAR